MGYWGPVATTIILVAKMLHKIGNMIAEQRPGTFQAIQCTDYQRLIALIFTKLRSKNSPYFLLIRSSYICVHCV